VENRKKRNTAIPDSILTYLYQSVADIQNTIRAIDTKLGLLLLILSLPFSNLGKIHEEIETLLSQKTGLGAQALYILLSIGFGLSWIGAFGSAIRAIISIENPSRHISGVEDSDLGTFYLGGLFKVRFIDSFFNRKNLASKMSFTELFDRLPDSPDRIVKEMLYEQAKLAYIRDMKTVRQLWAFRFTFLWLLLGFLIYLI